MSVSARQSSGRAGGAPRHAGARTAAPRLGGIGLLVVVAWAGGAAQAQQPGQQQVGKAALTRVGGYLDFQLRYRERNQDSKVGAGNTRNEESIFQEKLGLETEGYVYHPNFMEFSAAAAFGLLQYTFEDQFDDILQRSSDDGDILEFDLRADFLKRKPYPGTIFGRRYQELIARPFQSSLQTVTTNYGVVWQYVSAKTPTSFQFSDTDVQLDPLNEDEEDGRQKNQTWRFETAYNISDHNAFSFVFNRMSIDEEPYELKYDANEYTLGHRLNFGDGHRHRLDSELNYYDQVGTFDLERFRWLERLRLEHTERLRTRYEFELIDRTQGNQAGVPPIQERSYRIFGEVEHELYDSLVSQFSGFAQMQRFESGLDIDRYGTAANFNYRKKNPLGVLRSSYRAGFIEEERSGGDQIVEVLDERVVLKDPEPAVLANSQIDTSSIFVTAEDRVTVYQLSRDYTLRVVGDRTEMERVPTGRIPDGAIVLVDYTYFVGGNFTLDTVTQDFFLQQDFDFGLAPYYRLRWQDQTLEPEFARGAIAEDITGNILGVEYRLNNRLRLWAEYEDFDSNIQPFRANRLGAEYNHPFSFGATGILKARWSDIDYFPPIERQRQFYTIEGRYRHPLTKHLTFEGVVLYRNDDDSLAGDDEGVDVDLTLEWIIRQTEIEVTYEFGQFEDQFSENDYQTLFVRMRRRF